MHGRSTFELSYSGSLAAKTIEEQMPQLGNRGLKETATKWKCFRQYDKKEAAELDYEENNMFFLTLKCVNIFRESYKVCSFKEPQ